MICKVQELDTQWVHQNREASSETGDCNNAPHTHKHIHIHVQHFWLTCFIGFILKRKLPYFPFNFDMQREKS